MSDSGDPDVTRLLRDLTRELQTLQRELDSEGSGRLSTRRQLSRFTSEIAIPSVILVLETNIRALKLLRRTIRLAEGREPRSQHSRAAGEVRDRAELLGQQALSRLDQTLETVQSSLEEEGADEDVRRLLAEARSLQDQISQQLATEESTGEDRTEDGTTVGVDSGESEPVNIDVDAELQTLKDNLEDDDGDEPDGTNGDGDAGADGSDSGEYDSGGHDAP
ncbi:DUF7547 family protein [Halovenus sp. HT40]|uniref:DUF7547 family protein n=1 Tax=Halovenus sp. HT40 TaxID=3126691 RepID=UPI00300F269A